MLCFHPLRFTLLLYYRRYAFDRYAPLKEKHVRSNQAAFVNKNLKKTIIKRSRLLNNLGQKSKSSYVAYKKQRDFCVKLAK